jgi:hypothetical protein
VAPDCAGETLIMAAESKAARIKLNLAEIVFGCDLHLGQKDLPINTPHLLLGQGKTLQGGCNGMAAL